VAPAPAKPAYEVNIDTPEDCIAYLKAKMYFGSTIRIEFGPDGGCKIFNKADNSNVFNSDFGKTPSIKERFGSSGRKVEISGVTSRNLGGAVQVQKDTLIQFILLNNGTIKIGSEALTQTDSAADPQDLN